MATTTLPIAPPQIRHQQCFIGGQWVDSVSGKTFATVNPATEEEICQVAEGDAEDVDLAVQAARNALENGPWAGMDARDRGGLMYKLADLIEQELDELAALETLDNGKPIRDARAADLPLVIDCLRYYAGYADKFHGKTIPVRGNFFTYTRREPIGVAGQIIPWNFPLLMAAWKWGPALAAGCTIVMKPAEQTPLTCLRLAQLAQDAGFPDGVINVVPGFGPTAGAAVVKHPGVDKVAFTGEYKTAQIIMRDAAETLKRLTFELGGKSPNIVFADADLEAAAAGAHFGLFFNQGQCCCAGSRLFVEESIHDKFVDKLVALSKDCKIGDPLDPETQQGPQVDKAQFDKIMEYIDLGNRQGAQCLTGGQRAGERGYFIEPTVFDAVTDDMAIATEEIFGPVMNILKFKDVDEIVDRANNTFYGLAAAVWTRDIGKAHHIARHVKAGTVWVNCYDVFDAAAPFGGFKMSGIGRELGEKALDNYLEDKTVTVALD
ncbi:MAG: aldehyde dehydrogenase family protein [Planctomycetales bacterium]|nr:aldehyde dehydrogenase family protein [Planctomycetales bacterium]NIM09796.1 aldehyde dehydrogenase family protein [Planctomycetales bacterium]NIN09265.1 aldehyde dehydrogenase family protein [Planctomycetales bacterium]NIN78368.1 aldehyde dehydrogenase family protein [Planctomycetales bacterium]NIO35544.1 aldehyde dehydrogenase family protein [Planctomycetales bacterium]